VNPTDVLIAKLNLLLANSEEILRHLPASPTAASNVQAQLLTVAEAAIYLGRSPQSIQHLIFEKQLPIVRVGRRVHLHRKDLDAWIEENKY
jgi:excisionase family DNA binding protein